MHPDLRNAIAEARIADLTRSASERRTAAAAVPRRGSRFARPRIAQRRLAPASVQIAGTPRAVLIGVRANINREAPMRQMSHLPSPTVAYNRGAPHGAR
jgi:hypothetical protein